MAYLVESLSQFLIFIGIGLVLFFPVVSLKETGVGFGKLILSVCFGSFIAAGALWTYSALELNSSLLGGSLGALFLLIVVSYFILNKYEKPIPVTSILFIIFSIFSAILIYSLSASFIEGLYLFTSILFVGCTSYLMLLGHYYLVVPKLSERPLILLHYLLWTVIAVKLALSSYSYLTWSDSNNEMWDTVFIAMRMLWGYLAIGVLSYFSYRLSQMRSTQSATGVLYVIVFFMIVGELLSYYFYNSKGLFI